MLCENEMCHLAVEYVGDAIVGFGTGITSSIKMYCFSYAYYIFKSWQLPGMITNERENWTSLMNFNIMEIIS